MNRLQGHNVQATGCTNSQRKRNVFSAVLKALTVSIALISDTRRSCWSEKVTRRQINNQTEEVVRACAAPKLPTENRTLLEGRLPACQGRSVQWERGKCYWAGYWRQATTCN